MWPKLNCYRHGHICQHHFHFLGSFDDYHTNSKWDKIRALSSGAPFFMPKSHDCGSVDAPNAVSKDLDWNASSSLRLRSFSDNRSHSVSLSMRQDDQLNYKIQRLYQNQILIKYNIRCPIQHMRVIWEYVDDLHFYSTNHDLFTQRACISGTDNVPTRVWSLSIRLTKSSLKSAQYTGSS